MVVSTDGAEDARRTARAFPRFDVVSDADASLGRALGLIDPSPLSPVEHDIYAPTQVVLDGDGRVRGIWRGDDVGRRRPIDEALAALDALKNG